MYDGVIKFVYIYTYIYVLKVIVSAYKGSWIRRARSTGTPCTLVKMVSWRGGALTGYALILCNSIMKDVTSGIVVW